MLLLSDEVLLSHGLPRIRAEESAGERRRVWDGVGKKVRAQRRAEYVSERKSKLEQLSMQGLCEGKSVCVIERRE